MRHVTIGLLGADLVALRAHDVRSIVPTRSTAPLQARLVRMGLHEGRVTQVHEDAALAPGKSLTIRDGVVPLLDVGLAFCVFQGVRILQKLQGVRERRPTSSAAPPCTPDSAFAT